MSRTTLNSEGSSIPVLSEEAQAALAEFYQEQQEQESTQENRDEIKLVSCGSNQNQAFQPIRPEDNSAVYQALEVYHHLPDGLVVATLAVPKTFDSLRAMRKYAELHNFDIYNSETDVSIPFHLWPVMSNSDFEPGLEEKFDVLFSKLVVESEESAKQLYDSIDFLLAESGLAIIQATESELQLLKTLFDEAIWTIDENIELDNGWNIVVISKLSNEN